MGSLGRARQHPELGQSPGCEAWAQRWSWGWTWYWGLLTASQPAPDPRSWTRLLVLGFPLGEWPGTPCEAGSQALPAGVAPSFLEDEGSLVQTLASYLRQKLNRRVFVLASFTGRLRCCVLVSECKTCPARESDGRHPRFERVLITHCVVSNFKIKAILFSAPLLKSKV